MDGAAEIGGEALLHGVAPVCIARHGIGTRVLDEPAYGWNSERDLPRPIPDGTAGRVSEPTVGGFVGNILSAYCHEKNSIFSSGISQQTLSRVMSVTERKRA